MTYSPAQKVCNHRRHHSCQKMTAKCRRLATDGSSRPAAPKPPRAVDGVWCLAVIANFLSGTVVAPGSVHASLAWLACGIAVPTHRWCGRSKTKVNTSFHWEISMTVVGVDPWLGCHGYLLNCMLLAFARLLLCIAIYGIYCTLHTFFYGQVNPHFSPTFPPPCWGWGVQMTVVHNSN